MYFEIDKLAFHHHSTMEVFSKFHQIPFSKMLTFYRTDPFVLEASYIGKDIPHSNTSIGTYLLYLLIFYDTK